MLDRPKGTDAAGEASTTGAPCAAGDADAAEATAAEGAAGEPCDLVRVPARQGLEAVDILRLRRRGGVGPVMCDGASDTLGFLVPPGTADCWDGPGSACARAADRLPDAGSGPAAPAPGPESGAARPARTGSSASRAPVASGADWIVPPEGAYAGTTEPAQLRAALGEAARTIEAADRC